MNSSHFSSKKEEKKNSFHLLFAAMHPRRRKCVRTSAPEKESNHFMKAILPSPIHSKQIVSLFCTFIMHACQSNIIIHFIKFIKCSNVFEILCDSFFCWCACVFAC